MRQPITPTLARQVLDSMSQTRAAVYSPDHPTVQDVKRAVSEELGIAVEELATRKRAPHLAWPRQLAMYLARELTGASLAEIGRRFGDRNHATVLHAHRQGAQRLAVDSDAAKVVERLRASLGSTIDDRPS
jgi:chromosomal replication initiator protein